MITIKRVASLLEVSKPTITKAIDNLGIEKVLVGNRYEIDSENLPKIIKYVRSEDFEKYSEKAEKCGLLRKENAKIENAENAKIEKNEKQNENNENKTANTEKENEKIEKISQKLIEMLEKQLDEKEETIKAQQITIDNLIKANTMLTLKLEDKEQKQENESANKEDLIQEPKKKNWFKRLFNID